MAHTIAGTQRCPHLLFLCLLANHSFRSVALTKMRQLNTRGESETVKVPKDTGARCLDGSQYIFHITPGNSKYWTFDFSSGNGTCSDESECAEKAKTESGSSSFDTGESGRACRNMDGLDEKFSCSSVELRYCDGGWWRGFRDDPVKTADGTELYIRGRRNLEITLKILKESYGLQDASEVIVTGNSAGGLSTMLNLDVIAQQLPGVKVRGLPVAGFTLDVNTCCNPDSCCMYGDNCCYISAMPSTYTFHNMTTIPDCEAYFQKDPSNCLLGAYASKFTKTPMFIMNSIYDSWQLKNEQALDKFELTENRAALGSLEEPVRQYGEEFLRQVDKVLDYNKNHSVFLSKCICHSECGPDEADFWDAEYNGVPIRQFVSAWYDDLSSIGDGSRIMTEDGDGPNYDCYSEL